MAKVILNQDEERTLYNINDDIFGARGSEVVTVAPQTTGVKMDQNVERVVLEGKIADFQFLQAGNNLKVYSGPNTVVATILVQDDSNGTQITFTDGTVNAMFDKSGAAPVIQLGDATVSGSSPSHVSVGSAFINDDLVTPPYDQGQHVFTLIETKEQVTTPGHDVLLWNGLPVESDSIEDFLKEIAEVDFAELGKNMNDITGVKDIQIDNKDGEATGTIVFNLADGTTVDINSKTSLEYLAFIKSLIFDENGNSRLTMGQTEGHVYEKDAAIVLTPTSNNGGTMESGYTTDGDDLIVAGRPELLHGAYIDGGGGYNTLEVDMKGVFAQPLALLNIQEIHVANLPNVYTTPLDGVDGEAPSLWHDDNHNGTIDYGEYGSTYPDLSTAPDLTSSSLDLNRAIDLQKLVITEGSGIGNMPLGELNIVGVRNGATVRLEGSFSEPVDVQFGEGIKADGVHLELNVGNTDHFALNIAQNSATLNVHSLGTENMLEHGFFGGDLRYLNITGPGSFYVENDLGNSFEEGRPATIDASGNTGGVDLNISGHEVVEFKGSHGDDHFRADGSFDLLLGGVQAEGLDLDDLNPIHAVKQLTITGGSGDNVYESSLFETANITSGDGNDTISALLGINVTINAGAGDNTITASAQKINIVTGSGDDTITVAGLDLDHLRANYYDPDHVIDGFAAGAVLKIDAGAGSNTIVLSNAISELLPSYVSDVLPDLPIGLVALEGSSITGSDITLQVDTESNLSAAALSGITSVVLDADLTLTADQVQTLGVGAFTTVHPVTTDHVETLHIVVDHDLTLVDLIGPSDNNPLLTSGVKLAFDIKEGATLTLTAEQLHDFVAPDGIHAEADVQDGHVILTDAGLHFNPFVDDDGDNVANGTIAEWFNDTDNLIIERTVGGFERPEPTPSVDKLIIDSDITPIVPPPPDTDTIHSWLKTLEIKGSQDLTFAAPVNLGTKFTIDFSQLQGELKGPVVNGIQTYMTVKQFDDVKQIIGHDVDPDGNQVFNTRINVELTDDVGKPGLEYGLKSSGVSEYVVTNLDGDYTFYTCDNTHDIKVLGLQGNSEHSITFYDVPWGHVSPTFLLEGDGYADFDGGSKADANPNESNIGTLNVKFFYPGAPATIDINNQGQLLGHTSVSDTDPRPLVVEGINLENAETVTINVSDGNAEILSFDGNQQVKDVTLSSNYDVALHLDSNENSLASINADAVIGTATLVIEAPAADVELAVQSTFDDAVVGVDLSDTTLSSIDKIVLTDHAVLTLSATEINDINLDNIVVEQPGDTAVLNVEDLRSGPFDVHCLSDGVEIGFVTIADLSGHSDNTVTLAPGTDLTGAHSIYVPEGTVLNLTAAQFEELAGAGTITGDGVVNITGLTQADIDNGLDLSNVQHAGTITLAEDVVLAGDTNLGDFAIKLAQSQTIAMATDDQAHDRVITAAPGATDTTVKFDFTTFDTTTAVLDNGTLYYLPGIDTSHYKGITKVEVLAHLVEGTNVEQVLAHLNQNIIVDVIEPTAENAVVNEIHRYVVLEHGVFVDAPLSFDDLNDNVDIATLDVTFLGAGMEGGIAAPAMNGIDGQGFQKLTVHSLGDGNPINTIAMGGLGSPFEPETNNFLNVEIDAQQEFLCEVIGFNSLAPDATATLNVHGPADVTFGKIVAMDSDIRKLDIIHDGTGTLNVGVGGIGPGGSALWLNDHQTITLSGSGDMVFGSITSLDPSIDSPTLNGIDASKLTGDLNLNVIEDVDSTNFTFTSGTGETHLVVADTLDAGGTWLFDMSNAGANSSITFTDVTAFTNSGTLTVTHDADTTVTVSDAAIDQQWEVNLLQNSTCVNVIDLTVNGAVTLDQASALADAKLSDNGTVTVLDTEINTQDEINALQALSYVDKIDLGTTAITLDVASALADTKIVNGDVTVTGVTDQATLDQLAALGYVDHVAVTQELALKGAPTGAITSYAVSDVLIDTAAEVKELQDKSYVTSIDLTKAGAVTLTEADANYDTKLGVDGTVTVSDAGINTQTQVQALQALPYVDIIDLTAAGAVTLDVATFLADKLGYNGTVTVEDSGAAIGSMTQAQLHSSSLDVINAIDNHITLEADQYTAIAQGTAAIDASDSITIKSDLGADAFNFNSAGGGAITLSFAPGTLGDFVTNFNPASDIIDYAALNAAPQAFEQVAAVGDDILTNANIIVFGGVVKSLDLAAQAVAADDTVTQAAGLIVYSDGNNTYVYASDNLADNGNETLVVQLTGITDATVLDTTNFVI